MNNFTKKNTIKITLTNYFENGGKLSKKDEGRKLYNYLGGELYIIKRVYPFQLRVLSNFEDKIISLITEKKKLNQIFIEVEQTIKYR